MFSQPLPTARIAQHYCLRRSRNPSVRRLRPWNSGVGDVGKREIGRSIDKLENRIPGTPAWTTLSTNATCQLEKTEKLARSNQFWARIVAPAAESLRRVGETRKPQLMRNVSDTVAVLNSVDAVNKMEPRVRSWNEWLPTNAVFKLFLSRFLHVPGLRHGFELNLQRQAKVRILKRLTVNKMGPRRWITRALRSVPTP